MKVGDYVRIKNGDIGKIKENDGELIKYCVGTLYGIDLDRNCLDREVLKSSPNIIDLIEVGDVLSFKDGSICRIIEISDNGYYLLKDYGGEQYYERKEYIDTLISIVTKEIFEQMEYKVNE